MGKFQFYQDIKCTVWERQYFEIEAQSEDEAKRMAVEYRNKDVSDHDVFVKSEMLLDTMEYITPESNGGYETIQLYYDKESQPFANNSSTDIKQQHLDFDSYKDAFQVYVDETSLYSIECSCYGSYGCLSAYHKDDKLVIVYYRHNGEIFRYTFKESWDSLVNQNENFRMRMVNFLTAEGGNCAPSKDEIHDWLAGHLTGMCGNDAVDDAVPFTLEDVVDVWGDYAEKYKYQPVKLIGYQVVGDDGEMPEGLFSFQVIKDKQEAENILAVVKAEEPHKKGMAVYPIYEGDIEEPSFI